MTQDEKNKTGNKSREVFDDGIFKESNNSDQSGRKTAIVNTNKPPKKPAKNTGSGNND